MENRGQFDEFPIRPRVNPGPVLSYTRFGTRP